jgi:hypothetical protein
MAAKEHQLRVDHPDGCSPCAVTIYDRDCLMDDDDPFVAWTPNLTPERVLVALDRARGTVLKMVEQLKADIADPA